MPFVTFMATPLPPPQTAVVMISMFIFVVVVFSRSNVQTAHESLQIYRTQTETDSFSSDVVTPKFTDREVTLSAALSMHVSVCF